MPVAGALRQPSRTLLITAAALPLTGWTVHAVALHRRIAAARRDPLTGLLRRDAYTAHARRLLRRYGDDVAVVLVDQGLFKAVTASGTRQVTWCCGRPRTGSPPGPALTPPSAGSEATSAPPSCSWTRSGVRSVSPSWCGCHPRRSRHRPDHRLPHRPQR
jgi:hypothetical protein